jgi:hypothetical protein
MNALLFSVLLAGLLALLVGFENDDADDPSEEARDGRGDASTVALTGRERPTAPRDDAAT